MFFPIQATTVACWANQASIQFSLHSKKKEKKNKNEKTFLSLLFLPDKPFSKKMSILLTCLTIGVGAFVFINLFVVPVFLNRMIVSLFLVIHVLGLFFWMVDKTCFSVFLSTNQTLSNKKRNTEVMNRRKKKMELHAVLVPWCIHKNNFLKERIEETA